jgi:hypothetical protein
MFLFINYVYSFQSTSYSCNLQNQHFRKVMEESNHNESRATRDTETEITEPEEIYLGTDGPEEVAVGQNGKKFKVSNKPPVFVCSSVRETHTEATFPVTKRQ